MLRPGYFLRRAASSLRENPFINLVTVGTIAIAMLLFGTFLLLVVNLKGVIDRLGGNVEISAYLRDGATSDQVLALGERLRHVPEVSEVKFVSKADALAVFKRVNPEDVPLLGLVEGNPFPASYQVKLAPGHRDGDTVKRLADDLMGDSAVDEVDYGQDWIGRFSAFLQLLQVGGVGLGLMLVVAVVFVVSNTIKLAVFARRDELEIMQLVGATGAFIRVPYLLEGLLQGGLGATLALAALWLAWKALAAKAALSLAPVFGSARLEFIPARALLALLLGGMVLGLAGSFFAMGRFLKRPRT